MFSFLGANFLFFINLQADPTDSPTKDSINWRRKMAPSQVSGHQQWSDPFSTLQPELNIEILEYLSLHDIRSVIMAVPMLLRTFQSNRRYILRSHSHELLQSYGEESSFRLAATATHLRALHSKHDGDSISELEKQVQPILDSILQSNYKKAKKRGDIRLYMLIAAQELLPEIAASFTMPWYQSIHLELYDRSPGSIWPDMAPPVVRTTFSKGFLRFDCYHNIFYHNHQHLLQNLDDMKEVFLNSFPEFPAFDDDTLRMYPFTILRNIFWRYNYLIEEVDDSLLEQRSDILRRERTSNEISAAIRRIQFLNRSPRQYDYFLCRLCLQGYPRLDSLEQLSYGELENAILKEFEELVTLDLENYDIWVDKVHYYDLLEYFILEGSSEMGY
jgi:hypothetical protein